MVVKKGNTMKQCILTKGINILQKYREIWNGLAILLLLSLVLSFLLRGFGAKSNAVNVWCLSIGLQAVLLTGLTLFALKRDGAHILSISDVRLPKREVVTQALQGGFILFAMVYVLSILLAFFATDLEVQAVIAPLMRAQGLGQKFLILLVGAVLVPISEELLFRGYMYNGLKRRMTSKHAMVAVALVFALLHGDWQRFLLFFIGGLWLNEMYRRSGSLWSSVIAHSVWNGCMLLLLFL